MDEEEISIEDIKIKDMPLNKDDNIAQYQDFQ